MRHAIVVSWLAAALPAFSHPDLSVTLERLLQDIQADSGNIAKRNTRAWVLLDRHEPAMAEDDINHLLTRPEWHAEGLELSALRFLQVGKTTEAKAALLGSLKEGGETVRKFRLLTLIECARKDTVAAIAAGRHAWEMSGEESDFILVCGLWTARGNLPEGLYVKAQARYAAYPGAIDALFSACLQGKAASPSPCHELSSQALKWWPGSIDWRLKHARALLQAGRPHDADQSLLEALDLLDANPNAKVSASFGMQTRREIFALRKDLKEK